MLPVPGRSATDPCAGPVTKPSSPGSTRRSRVLAAGCARSPRVVWTTARMLRKRLSVLSRTLLGLTRRSRVAASRRRTGASGGPGRTPSCPVRARPGVLNVAARAVSGGRWLIGTGGRINPFFIAVMQARVMPEATVGVRAPARTPGRARIPRVAWTIPRMRRKRSRVLNRTPLGSTRRFKVAASGRRAATSGCAGRARA